MKFLRSALYLLFLRVPAILFGIAGIVRITNRARRNFKKALRGEGLPAEAVEELGEHFTPKFPSPFKR